MAFPSGTAYHADSDADDEYERSVMTSPTQLHTDSETSPTDSDLPSENTPTTYGNGGEDHHLPRTIITEWTTEECAQFVADLGLRQYCDAIIENNIDGIALVALRHEDLKEMNVASVGHRLTILKSVYDVKVSQDITIEPDEYIPLSAEQSTRNETATKEDVQRWARSIIKSRDERLEHAEDQLRELTQAYNKLRLELGPIFQKLKPLPEVPGYHLTPSSPDPNSLEASGPPDAQSVPEKNGLSRRPSHNPKKLHVGTGSKNHSPTHIPSTFHDGRVIPDQSFVDTSAAATAASAGYSAVMSSNALPLASSPSFVPELSPTSPGPAQSPILPSRVYRDGGAASSGGRNVHEYPRESKVSRIGATGTPSRSHAIPAASSTVVQQARTSVNGTSSSAQWPTSASGGSTASADTPSLAIFRPLKINPDDPCHKVLPAALREYKIRADWQQYALYIVYGDQERCIRWDERPLPLLKELEKEGKMPMFMQLRKLAPSSDTPSSASMRPPGSGAGGVPIGSGASIRTATNMLLDVPGGVL